MVVTDSLTQAQSSLLGEAWSVFRSSFYLCLAQQHQTICFGSFRAIKMSSKILLVVENERRQYQECATDCGCIRMQMSVHPIELSPCSSSPWSLSQPGQTSKRGRNGSSNSLWHSVWPSHGVAKELPDSARVHPVSDANPKSVLQLLIKHLVGSIEFQLYLRNCLVSGTKGFKRHKSTCWFLDLRAKVLDVFVIPKTSPNIKPQARKRRPAFQIRIYSISWV